MRKNKVEIPTSKTIFEKNDLVVLLVKRDYINEVEDIFSVSSI